MILLALWIIGTLLFLRACGHLLKAHLWSGIKMLITSLLCLILAGLLSGICWSLSLLNNLTYQTPIATLSIKAIPSAQTHVYRVIFQKPGHAPQAFILTGDDWMLGAHTLIFKPWVQALGLHNKYQLDFLSAHQNPTDAIPTVHQNQNYNLASHHTHGALFNPFNRLVFAAIPFLIQTQEGSAVYMPLQNNTHYQILMASSGLIAKPLTTPLEHSYVS